MRYKNNYWMDSALINMHDSCWIANLFEQPGLGMKKEEGRHLCSIVFSPYVWGPDLLPVNPSIIINMMPVEGSHSHI